MRIDKNGNYKYVNEKCSVNFDLLLEPFQVTLDPFLLEMSAETLIYECKKRM